MSCEQVSMHTCAGLYISMWNPETNVQTTSSSVSDVPSNTGSTDLTTSGFPLGVQGLRAQGLRFVQQVLYQLSHLPG